MIFAQAIPKRSIQLRCDNFVLIFLSVILQTAINVKTRTGVKNLRNGYGMTELTIMSNLSSRNDDESCGKILPGFLSKIIDPETQETLNGGQIGEICFKSEQVMMYYWDDPEVTNKTIDRDGWMHTGDIGYYDEKERLHVVDRLKELIKYKGYQVSPSEIEGLLLSHPAVKDVAVAGKPDEYSGEVPMAFIVKKPGATVTVQDIQEFVKRE
jgi:acyl-CoA synthetase (AMP-forming)/AMP-acid ligase II